MKIVTDKNNPAARAGELLSDALNAGGAEPTLLLLAGGSALALLSYVKGSALPSRFTVGMLDERYSTDTKVNNYAQLMESAFYATAAAASATFIDSRSRLSEPAAAVASRLHDALTAWRRGNPTGRVIATLGMGPDGHTAGIFPGFVTVLSKRGQWVEAYEVPKDIHEYTTRITVTPHFLTTEVNHAVAYVVGKDKHSVLATLTAHPPDPELLPAALWYQIPNVTIVTDLLLS